MPNQAKKDLTNMLHELGHKHDIHNVFTDFVEMSAIAVSNRIDLMQYEAREQRYLEIVKKYSKDDLDKYANMLALLISALKHEAATGKLNDVLGTIYHELELHNKWKAQFFTPQHVCDMMGMISLASEPEGKTTLLEPCVGSGAMVLGFVNSMIDKKLSYTRDLEVTAIDSDLKCVHMAYLQFYFYGIPATVIHGNSLTNEQWSDWKTPTLFMRL